MDAPLPSKVIEFLPWGEAGKAVALNLGYYVDPGSHYKMRNDDPFGLPDYAALLRPLRGTGLEELRKWWLKDGRLIIGLPSGARQLNLSMFPCLILVCAMPLSCRPSAIPGVK
jgi:hypothetical protein